MGVYSSIDVEVSEYIAMGLKNNRIVSFIKRDYPGITKREIDECIKYNRKRDSVVKPRRIK